MTTSLRVRDLRVRTALGGVALCAALLTPAFGDTSTSRTVAPGPAPTVEERWRPSFDAFEAADRLHPPAPGGIVFVGSSTFRLWGDLAEVFGERPKVLNRGFGGSTMADCRTYSSRLVVPYRPRLVVVYAGENDLAAGRTPQEVLDAFAGFVDGVRSALPDVRIAYVSIKPSPAREALIPAVRTANALILAYTATVPNTEFIDVYSKMIGVDGRPKPELYRADRLHLNEAGYAVWKDVIAGHLR